MGNPYPVGLTPVVVEYGLPGARDGHRPLRRGEDTEPGGIVVTDDYLYQTPHDTGPA